MNSQQQNSLRRQIKAIRSRIRGLEKEIEAGLDELAEMLTEALNAQGSLQAWRVKKGMSQRDLAEAVGVSNMTISHWENRINRPSDFHLEKLRELGYTESQVSTR
jgi:DNA-binding transcriptional regulator YiaG